MPSTTPRTKQGKKQKVATVMQEMQAGTLKSSSGQTVTNPKQGLAIALNTAGLSKPTATARPASRKRSSKPPDVVVVQRS